MGRRWVGSSERPVTPSGMPRPSRGKRQTRKTRHYKSRRGTIYRATAKQGQGWRDGNACTTGELRGFLRGAYTDGESLLWARIGRIGVFASRPEEDKPGQAPQPEKEGRAVRIQRTGFNQTWKK